MAPPVGRVSSVHACDRNTILFFEKFSTSIFFYISDSVSVIDYRPVVGFFDICPSFQDKHVFMFGECMGALSLAAGWSSLHSAWMHSLNFYLSITMKHYIHTKNTTKIKKI